MDENKKQTMIKMFPKIVPGSVINVPCKVSSFTIVDGDNGESVRLRLHPIGFRTIDIECNSIERIFELFDDLNNESTSTESCESNEYILDMRVHDMLFKAKQETGDTIFRHLTMTKLSHILTREKEIVYVKDLINFSLHDISTIKGFGDVCYACLTTALDHFNIKLKEK